jgi:hypothetical protein
LVKINRLFVKSKWLKWGFNFQQLCFIDKTINDYSEINYSENSGGNVSPKEELISSAFLVAMQ